MPMKPVMLRLINFWPPFLGAGIRVRHIAADFRRVEVEMRLRPWNKNYVGTQFGGSLYAMTDPFFMLMVMESLGRDYIVWDKAATIRFRRPGRGLVRATFELAPDRLTAIRDEVAAAGKAEPIFHVHIVDDAGHTIAEVDKTIYVRKKRPSRPQPSATEPT